ncbi:peroxisomal biogenesis factor 3 [Brachionus plicatilis]|uniref:Peroxisomal biogenesis factor 3 n=1 Tax=Brachionus plicatilis TaxID=10195 RepID=A0A3M7QRF3_BRAPC|nr:peroxisomal biogenesis factor 3 [Brachionus plicatilis]
MSLVFRFGKRHKKKLVFSAFLFGGSYAFIKYSIYKIKKSLFLLPEDSRLVKKEYLKSKKFDHYLAIKKTSDDAILSIFESIQEQINNNLSSNEYLEQLKLKPPNKLELWEKIKILSVSKCLASIYSMVIVSILTKIELNIVGGFLFRQIVTDGSSFDNIKSSSQINLSAKFQKKYLENIEKFSQEGIKKLCLNIRPIVEKVFENINLKENIGTEYLNEKLELTMELFEAQNDDFVTEYLSFGYSITKGSLESEYCLVDASNPMVDHVEENILSDLNNETLDLILCEDFKQTFRTIFDDLKNDLLNNLSSLMLTQILKRESPEKISISLPFAKLIPILNQIKLPLNKNIIIDNISLNIFSANIYEAFSYFPEESFNYDSMGGLDVNMLLKELV